jgi:hypothetical protein
MNRPRFLRRRYTLPPHRHVSWSGTEYDHTHTVDPPPSSIDRFLTVALGEELFGTGRLEAPTVYHQILDGDLNGHLFVVRIGTRAVARILTDEELLFVGVGSGRSLGLTDADLLGDTFLDLVRDMWAELRLGRQP